ncbi:MAG: succinate dehydrogenase, cytochrome b556 subunit [Halioglobus sp.]|nr:succinate dehydrogenase, cytochrome b556 subunit [Halioglobus sp.]
MKDKRPVNLDIVGSMHLPVTAWISITHRITGVILFAAVAVLLWALDTSLAGPESFDTLRETLGSPVFKLVMWAVLAVLIYHGIAGVKHLIMDFGIGESMEGGVLGARIVIALSLLCSVVAGVWLW